MAKSKSDIPLGGAEQNMSREELAAVAKAVAALSPEDRESSGHRPGVPLSADHGGAVPGI